MIKFKLVVLILIYLASASMIHSASKNNPLELFLKNLNSLEVSFTQRLLNEKGKELEMTSGVSVSYTHLTLPTILRV